MYPTVISLRYRGLPWLPASKILELLFNLVRRGQISWWQGGIQRVHMDVADMVVGPWQFELPHVAV